MSPNDFPSTIQGTSLALRQKQFSATELTRELLSRAHNTNSQLNAYITIADELALKQAKLADHTLAQGNGHILTGVPYTMKDVYLTSGIPTTAASKVLNHHISQYDATVYSKLTQLGGVLLGKNNQDAWGHGGSSENTDYGPVHNPYALDRIAGGSGGGTAAAIAAETAIYGISEDTGGSTRNPAAYCNLVGLKVTYGRVSRYGAIPYASSFDTINPTAHTAEDTALILTAIAGFDPHDASSSHDPVPDYSSQLNKPLKGKVIGYVPELMAHGLNSELQAAIDQALQVYIKLGAKVKKVSLPTAKLGHAIYYILVLSETSSNLARYDAVRYGTSRSNFTTETKRRIMTGTYTLSSGYYDAYYKKAQQARALLIREFTAAFSQVDTIMLPVMPFPPYKIGGLKDEFDTDSYAVALYLADIYTCLANTVGIPSLAHPIGFTRNGLPLSFQLHGPMFSESLLLNFAHQYQQVTDWHTRRPNI